MPSSNDGLPSASVFFLVQGFCSAKRVVDVLSVKKKNVFRKLAHLLAYWLRKILVG